MENINHNSPAFPPQVAQDNLGRLIAPIPGMSKLEYFSLKLLPYYLELSEKYKGHLQCNGYDVSPQEAAIIAAKNLLDTLQEDAKKLEDQAIIKPI